MITFLIALCSVLAVLAIVQTGVLGFQQLENRRFARSRRKLQLSQPWIGRAAVLAPCRGVDPGFADTLKCLFEQDHPDFELVFIVESPQDPVYESIRQTMAAYPAVRARIVIAGRATDCGQKVHNLCVATADLPPHIDTLAFVDSDARPQRDWLRRLVQRLNPVDYGHVGAVTGYRWFVPTRPSLANYLMQSVNAMVACLLGPGGHYLIWGGSWAIRRDRFEELGIRRAWQGTLNDDLVASDVIRRAGLRIDFEPSCVVASPVDISLSRFFEFLRRQYFTARIYARRWWAVGLVSTSLLIFGYFGCAVSVVLALMVRSRWLPVSATLMASLVMLCFWRALVRVDLSAVYTSELGVSLVAAHWFDLLAHPVAMLVNWVGIVSSAFGRTIWWRGTRYRVVAPNRIRILGDQPAEGTCVPSHGPGAPPPHFPCRADQPQRDAAGR